MLNRLSLASVAIRGYNNQYIRILYPQSFVGIYGGTSIKGSPPGQ